MAPIHSFIVVTSNLTTPPTTVKEKNKSYEDSDLSIRMLLLHFLWCGGGSVPRMMVRKGEIVMKVTVITFGLALDDAEGEKGRMLFWKLN